VRSRVLIPLFVALLACDRPAAADMSSHIGVGGSIVNGTPVAVVVRAGSSEIASYRRPGAASGPTWTCGYHALGAETDTVLPSLGRDRVSPEPGRYYGLLCRDDDGRLVYERYLRYELGDPFSGMLAAERAAALAYEELVLPQPDLRHNPPGEQVVGIPTWLWIDDAWEPRSASATIGDVTSTVSAEPVDVTWELGDGTTVVCPGPGSPYEVARPPEAQSTDCRHTYIWSSHSHPAGAYELRARMRYRISWTASTGEGGDLGGLTRAGTVPLFVREIQALIR
jgi:hypothetical protein